MIFTLLTFLAAFGMAAVSEWFSVVGIMAIYAGAPYNAALIMGIVLGGAKLVTISWLYRNWAFAGWGLRLSLTYFTLALMIASSIGVFGFLSKAHLEQGAATIDNTAKVERLDQRIAREKSVIADNEQVISQLDATINSFIGKDRADRALSVRRSQAPQRKQLRETIDLSQSKIDEYSDEKLKLTSQVRAIQLEVGPIKYIADMFTSESDDSTKIELAIKLFTLLIVSTLDPLAVMLLVAANHTLLRLQDEKKKHKGSNTESTNITSTEEVTNPRILPEPADTGSGSETMLQGELAPATCSSQNSSENSSSMDETLHALDARKNTRTQEEITNAQDTQNDMDTYPQVTWHDIPSRKDTYQEGENQTTEIPAELGLDINSGSSVETEIPSEVAIPVVVTSMPWAHQNSVLRELIGNDTHFIPQKLNEENKEKGKISEHRTTTLVVSDANNAQQEEEVYKEESESLLHSDTEGLRNEPTSIDKRDKYPVRLSWLKEFKGD